MKFDKVLNEVFSHKAIDDRDYYSANQENKKNKPARYKPRVVEPDLNRTNSVGSLKVKKK